MENKTALVVDDSRSARFALRKFLESKGYAVETADGANEAFVYLKRRRPSVVFLDHMMPGIDGFDALRTMRLEPELSALPIIICSSNEGDAFVREARAQGATDVLPKPPNQQHIDTVLARVEANLASPAPAAKVQPIREPEVMIEHAVMKTVREAMPEARRPAPAAPTPTPPVSSAPTATPMPPPRAATAPLAATPAPPTNPVPPRPATEAAIAEQLRTEMETRLRRITQELYVQMGELKARFAVVDDELGAHSEERARGFAAEAAREQAQQLTDGIKKTFAEMRAGLETVLSQHTHRIEEQARTAAAQRQQIEQLTQTVEMQSRTIEEQNRRIDSVLQTLQTQNSRIDSLLSEFGQQRQRADALSLRLEEQSNRADAIARTMEEQSGRLDSIGQSFGDQRARFDALAQSLHETTEREAHTVAERVVLAVAKRISDQMAESFLRVLQQPPHQSMTG